MDTRHHGGRNGNSYLLRRVDKMAVGEMGVARRGPVPPMPEQLADQGQVLARHHGLTGGGMAPISCKT